MKRLFTTTVTAASPILAAEESSSSNNNTASNPPPFTASDTLSAAPPTPATESGRPSSRPTTRRNDPNHPLAPRGIEVDGGYEGVPLIHFYTLPLNEAQEEYELVSSRLVTLLKSWDYSSYSITIAHAGYEKWSAVPVIVVIATNLESNHAEQMLAEFDSTDRRFIRECFCYEGETRGYVSGDNFRMPQEKVNPGYSIGPSAAVHGADPDASSSLGFYFCFDGDDDVYATCVHHALGSSVPLVAVGSIPPIPIRHPSARDLDAVIMDNEADLQKGVSGQISEHALLMSIKSLKEYIIELKNQKTDFGLVVGSAFGVVDVDGQPVSEDWLVIKVNPDRVGENHICGAVAARRGQRGLQWIPRDSYGVYINGIEHLSRGTWVRKCGRTTGDTVGQVGFAYAHAKFDDNPTETREWTIITSAFGDTPIFSSKGDSGAAVIDRQGNLIGVVLGGTKGRPTVLKGHENLGPVHVTYITSAPFLLQRISEAFGRRVVVRLVDLDRVPGIIKVDEEDGSSKHHSELD